MNSSHNQENLLRLLRRNLLERLTSRNVNDNSNIVILSMTNNIENESENDSNIVNELDNLFSTNEPILNQEEFINRVSNLLPHRDISSIRRIFERNGNINNSSFQRNLLNYIENSRSNNFEYSTSNNISNRTLNRSNLLNIIFGNNEVNNSFEELVNEDEKKLENFKDFIKKQKLLLISNDYIDFRQYPLNINWKKINEEKVLKLCHIYNSYGLIATNIFDNLENKNFKLKIENFEHELLSSFFNFIKLKDFKSKNFLDFLSCLPDINDIKTIIKERKIQENDCIFLKLLLDIFEIKIIFFNKKLKIDSQYEELRKFIRFSVHFSELMKKGIIYDKNFKTKIDNTGFTQNIRENSCYTNTNIEKYYLYKQIINKIRGNKKLEQEYKEIFEKINIDFLLKPNVKDGLNSRINFYYKKQIDSYKLLYGNNFNDEKIYL